MSTDERPNLDPHPLSPYVAWAGKRNRDPILDVFKDHLPKKSGHVLELASGSGMHINFFAPHFPHLSFQPTDLNEHALENIMRVTWENEVKNVAKPIKLDLTDETTWPQPDDQLYDTLFVINIFQVAPISVADGMMKCAAHLLKDDGFLLIYGPFQIEGQFSTDSNKAFHETLSSVGVPEWGLKDVADLKKAAANYGLELKERINMPSNNFSLIFGKI